MVNFTNATHRQIPIAKDLFHVLFREDIAGTHDHLLPAQFRIIINNLCLQQVRSIGAVSDYKTVKAASTGFDIY
jgi:hypothetical protein